MRRLIIFLVLTAVACLGASLQFSATVQKDYAPLAPASITSVEFVLYYENDSCGYYDFVTTDTAKTGVYDTIITPDTDSIGGYRADWKVTLADGKILIFSQKADSYEQDSTLNAIANKTNFKADVSGLSTYDPASDSVIVDVSAADAGLIPAIEDSIYANRAGYQGSSAVPDSTLSAISYLRHNFDSLNFNLGLTTDMYAHYHADADTFWYVTGTDTTRETVQFHVGGTAGQRPDSIKELR